MKPSVNAALLSALVYPGVGHLYLKNYVRSAIFVTIFSVPLYLMIREIIVKAQAIIQQVNSGEIPLDITAISAAVSNSITGANAQEMNFKIYALVIIWLLAVIDSYRLGRIKT